MVAQINALVGNATLAPHTVKEQKMGPQEMCAQALMFIAKRGT